MNYHSVTLQSHQLITSAQYINDQYSLFISAEFIYHLSSPQLQCPVSDLSPSELWSIPRIKMKFLVLCGNFDCKKIYKKSSYLLLQFPRPK